MPIISKIEAEEFRLSEILRPEGVALNYHAENVAEALGQVVALLVRAKFIQPADAPLARLSFLDREEITPTGYKYGIAMPHAHGPWTMGAVIAHYHDGLDWPTPDNLPVNLVIGVALPESGFRSYSIYIPQLADTLAQGRIHEKVLIARGPSDIIDAIEEIETNESLP
jgi:mannitol/fructose-specific phosphotransferase system IIA component (Ntr-type)